MLFIDTSAFIAIVNKGDRWHESANKLVEDIKEGRTKLRGIVTSDYVIDETLTKIRYSVGHKEAVEWGKSILASSLIQKVIVDDAVFNEAWELFQRYEDKKLSFTDCTSVVIMRNMGINTIFAFDEDFLKIGFNSALQTER